MDVSETIEQTRLVDLADEAARDRALVGSKAANLAVLIQSGFNVPDGVVVTTGEVDDGLAGQIIQRLGEGPLAVRSSATAEDLPDASYAGQYESYLDVQGRERLKEAVAKCRESAHSERVATYAGDTDGTPIAVLIQPMVDAIAAGVAFSAHPVTGARDQVVVNAVEGLGDRLVSGEVTPNEWIVVEDYVDGASGVISTSQVLEVAALARRVETHFGRPQDLEWAIDDDRLWLLQARPITALPQVPIELIPIEYEIPPGYWEHDASHAPAANYPIESFIPTMVGEAVKSWANEFGYLFDGIEFRDIGGWTYQRLAPMGGKEGPELPGWLMWVVVRTVPIVRRRLAGAREAIQSDKAGQYIDRWYDTWLPELASSIESLKSVDLTTLDDAGLVAHIATARRLCTRGIEVHALLHGSLAMILYELATTCERLLGWDMASTLETVRGTSYKSTEPARQLADLAGLAAERREVLKAANLLDHEVVSWLEEIDPEFAEAFQEYVNEYGHLALGQSVVEPTYAEMPALLMATIKHQVDTGFRPEHGDDANRIQRDKAIETARARLVNRPNDIAEFETALARGQKAYPVREDNEFFTFSMPFAQFRYAVLELGIRLLRRGVIETRDDIMFLELDEAIATLSDDCDLRTKVQFRKGRRAWAVANPGPPFYGKQTPPPSDLSFLPEDTRLPMEAMLWSLESIMAVGASKTTQSDPALIRGTAVSAGSYTGVVKVVRDETEFKKIKAGDVLVCPITSPVWSVLFPSIGALVTDTGGVLSHPAIIAREYRIPAVVATGNATSLLKDGEMVTVDGSTGTVTLLEPR